jgi:hypothetical protein
MAYGDDQISANPVARFGGLGLGVGAYLLGGFIPILLTGIALIAVKKLFPRLSEAAAFFAGLASGHLLWFLAGAIIVPAGWFAVAPDLVIGAVLIGLFVVRPSGAPAALLILFEVAGLGMNGWVLAEAGFSNPAAKPLFLHIALRLAIIGSGIWYLMRRHDVPVAAEAFE